MGTRCDGRAAQCYPFGVQGSLEYPEPAFSHGHVAADDVLFIL